MRELELCMKYANDCKRCPLNKRCEEEYRKEMEQKSGGVSAKDLQVLWGGFRKPYMSPQKEPSKKHRQRNSKV